jgi:hypothetical protein
MLMDPTPLQQPTSTSPHQQQITVPDLYPFTSNGQYDNPPNRDRLSSNQHRTGDTRRLTPLASHAPLQPTSTLSQPQTMPQDALYPTQPQYPQQNRDPQNYPQQRQQRHQPSSSPPGPQNNQYLNSNQISSLSRHQPSSSPPGPQNNQYLNSNQISSLTRHQPSSSPPGPRNNQYLDSNQISSLSRHQPSSSPPGPRNPQYLDSHQISAAIRPPASPNTSQGASLSRPLVSPNTSQQGALYATQAQYNSPPSSSSQHRRTHSSEYDNGRPPVAHAPPPNPNRLDASIRPSRPGEGESMPKEWWSPVSGYEREQRATGTLPVLSASLYCICMTSVCSRASAVADSRTTDCTTNCPANPSHPATGGGPPASAATSGSGYYSTGAETPKRPNLSHPGLP